MYLFLILDDKLDRHANKNIKTMPLQSEVLDVSSESGEEISEKEEENDDEESEKEDGQELSDNVEECFEEEDSDEDDDDDGNDGDGDGDEDGEAQDVQQVVGNEKECIQRNDTVDLRTELKRRKELKRLNLVKYFYNR